VKDAGLAKDCRSCCTEDVDDAGSVKAASASVPRPARAPGHPPCFAPLAMLLPAGATAVGNNRCGKRRIMYRGVPLMCLAPLLACTTCVSWCRTTCVSWCLMYHLRLECMCQLSLHHIIASHWSFDQGPRHMHVKTRGIPSRQGFHRQQGSFVSALEARAPTVLPGWQGTPVAVLPS
jgi:hypothetical protein